jgi:hypothetical protein
MKKTISEKQIRYIVRSELKNYLINEGLLDDFKTNVASQIFNKDNLTQAFNKYKTDLASAAGIKTGTTQYQEIKNELDKLQVPSTQLQNIYNMFYNPKNNIIPTVAQAGNFRTKLDELKTIVKPILNSAKSSQAASTIPVPMQEVVHSAVSPSPQSSPQPQLNAAQKQAKERQDLLNKLNNYYSTTMSEYNKAKTAKQPVEMIMNSILLFATQFTNLIFQTKNLSAAQVAVINKIYELLDRHFSAYADGSEEERLTQTQQASQQSQIPPTT